MRLILNLVICNKLFLCVNIDINQCIKLQIELIKNNLFVFFVIFLLCVMFVPSVSAQEVTIPDWIKNNAGWWADGLIDDNSFVSGIQWLISNGIIMLELEVNNQDPDEEGRIAGGVLTGQNCNT